LKDIEGEFSMCADMFSNRNYLTLPVCFDYLGNLTGS
jgi:hypothetical protein